MGKIVDPTCVFRTANAAEVESALILLQRGGFATALQSSLEADVLVDEETELVEQGLSHSLWTAGASAEAAAASLRVGGFPGVVERLERRRGWPDGLGDLLVCGLAVGL